MTDIIRAALRRYAGTPVRQYLAERTKGAMIPADMEFSMTADCLVDEPREPIITPIGVLDHRGMMLVRVRIPIKVEMGFAIPNRSQEPDEVEAILPEDMLSVSDIGVGVAHVSPEEADEEYDEEEGDEADDPSEGGAEVSRSVKLSDILETLTGQGINVVVDVEFGQDPPDA